MHRLASPDGIDSATFLTMNEFIVGRDVQNHRTTELFGSDIRNKTLRPHGG